MIKAEHKYWARTVFNIYINRQFRKHFSGFYMVNNPPELNKDVNVILTPNHFSWWDGFLVDFINIKLFAKKFHILMLEEQLKRYWFFQKLGAFSLNQSNPKSIVETVNYFKELLNAKNNLISFYPQGEIELYNYKDLSLKNGLTLFLKGNISNTVIIPTAFKFMFYEEKSPFILVRFGETMNPEEINDYENYKKKFYENLLALEEAARERTFIKDLF